MGTACLFVVPVWPSRPFYQTLLRLSPAVFERVGHWAAGSNPFMQAALWLKQSVGDPMFVVRATKV